MEGKCFQEMMRGFLQWVGPRGERSAEHKEVEGPGWVVRSGLLGEVEGAEERSLGVGHNWDLISGWEADVAAFVIVQVGLVVGVMEDHGTYWEQHYASLEKAIILFEEGLMGLAVAALGIALVVLVSDLQGGEGHVVLAV